MACICNPITSGISKSCSNNTGGVVELLISDLCNITSVTSATGSVSAISMTGSFYEFAFNKETSSFTEQYITDLQAGSSFYEQTVSLIIPRREVSKRNTLALLTEGQKDLAVIVKDGNGIYWYLGEVEGMNVTNIESTSGVTKAEGSNYTITILGREAAQAKVVDSSVITGLGF